MTIQILKTFTHVFCLLILLGCGSSSQEASPSVTEMNLSFLETSQAKSSEVVFYKFSFYAENFEYMTENISRKKYKKFSFPEIPYTDALKIIVYALNISGEVICSGDTVIDYYPARQTPIQIELRCV